MIKSIVSILLPFYCIAICTFLASCAGVTLASVSTTAESLLGKGAAYVESLANMITTATPSLITAATDITQGATLYGLLPASSQQATTFAKVISIMNTVAGDAAATKSAVASMQASGVIPTVTTSPAATTIEWQTPKGVVYFTRDNESGKSLFYSLPIVAMR